MTSINEKIELGDFQTPEYFCKIVTNLINTKYKFSPKCLIEPTMGIGNFLNASLNTFSSIKRIIGIDLENSYIEQATEKYSKELKSNFVCDNAFSIDYHRFDSFISNDSLLCIGNPPWVTNSQLSSMNAVNLPDKNNEVKHNKGLDAITGKSNFDIAEYILLHLFDYIKARENTVFAFLVKSIVARNLFKEKDNKGFSFEFFDVYSFDSKKVFDVSCDAVLLIGKFCKKEGVQFASEYELNRPEILIKKYGFVQNSFVSNVDSFIKTSGIVGNSEIEWRQGIKHDCSKVMELTNINGKLMNKLGEDCSFLEKCERVFPSVKSSEIKGGAMSEFKHYVIVTQDRTGQDTSFLKKYPELFSYLSDHEQLFKNRKSVIYKKAPPFSIFGIGEYSFKNYKICLSGFYKIPRFTFLHSDKPVMADDTCYFIGTNSLELSWFLFSVLDNEVTYSYLRSISFSDSKRPFTKEVLQTINLAKLANEIGENQIISKIKDQFHVIVGCNYFCNMINEISKDVIE